MTTKEFFELVNEMRQAQRNYRKTQDPKWLDLAHHLEQQVDEILERAMNYYTTHKQQ